MEETASWFPSTRATPAKRQTSEENDLDNEQRKRSRQSSWPPKHSHESKNGIYTEFSSESTPTVSVDTSGTLGAKEDLVCFGMICFEPVAAEPIQPHGVVAVQNGVSGSLLSHDSMVPLATLTTRDAKILKLFRQESIEMEIRLIPGYSTSKTTGRRGTIAAVTLYGCEYLGEPLQEALQQLVLYLQDPIYATRDNLYWNPQRFYNPPGQRTTVFRRMMDIPPGRQEQVSPVDYLAGFCSEVSLAETQGSPFLLTPLLSHQKQALTFMINRERGWTIQPAGVDVWSLQCDQYGPPTYVNNIDGQSYPDPPPRFTGGILADGMGFGKSLSMIALIAHDKVPATGQLPDAAYLNTYPVSTRTNIIVVPSALIQTWKEELTKRFSWRCHHKTTKVVDSTDLASVDIHHTRTPLAPGHSR
ncbi:hypothetical protein GGS23DRAFT_205845 [Durotheca rogersii]|uniref:uncharacterized protein n=1 Tax=Durotheca rogersii TaxID=419775 RepID=UPI00221E3879|nr:uncharacterized protein GGS23DRAFT_205845 [Durotheca rogersii]KAI5861037.1 hypothetical protein GGS23DRAFT_205845 [Durotheca rogersii]